jgi:hypothetical protein
MGASMVNGNHALLPLVEEPTPPSDKLVKGPAQTGIATAIGQATADAVDAFSTALLEHWGGKLSFKTKDIGGGMIARLYELQQAALGELDFDATARVFGRQALQARHAAAWRAQHGTDLPETVLDGLLDEVLAIVARVTNFERAMAN